MKTITICFFDDTTIYIPIEGPRVCIPRWQGTCLVEEIGDLYPDAEFTARVVTGVRNDTCWTEYCWTVRA